MSFNTSTNASAAKLIGAGTIGLAVILVGEWGITPAAFLAAAGGILVVGAGDELARFSIRNLVLFVGYWGLLMISLGLSA